MATMIPENISGMTNVTAGEKRVFKLLKELLPDDYIVWYELRVEKKHPDFIIVGPDLGLVVIEVKDWQIGSIVSADKNNYELKTDIGMTKNPQSQARSYMWEIINNVKKDPYLVSKNPKFKGKPIFNYGHGVIFTRIAKKSFIQHNLKESIDINAVMFQDDIKNIEENRDGNLLKEKILAMLPCYFEDNKLDEKSINRLRGNIFKEVKLQTDNDAVFNVMNLKQEQYAKGLGYGHRVIRGVAGSGKTVVITCRAKYLSEIHKDWNILTLCYNTSLSTHLKGAIDSKVHSNIEIRHFHGWINDILKELNLKSGVYDDEEITSSISSIKENMIDKLTKYDAILIDEGQDLDKEWLKFIVKMLRNPEHSHLVLASDGAQNLYNRKYTLKSVGIKAAGRTVIMRENYRNTKEILDFAHKFITDDKIVKSVDEEDNNFFIDPRSSLKNGPEPRLIKCNDFYSEIDVIIDRIKELNKLGVDYKDICILYFYGKQLGIIESKMISNKIPYFAISKSAKNKKIFNYNDNKVKISTIHSAKGLDFKFIFLCGIYKNLSKRYNESKKLIYVGMTRARDELFITYSIDSDITQHLIESAENFDEHQRRGSSSIVLKNNRQIKKSDDEIATTIEALYPKKNASNTLPEEAQKENKSLIQKVFSLFK